MTDLAPVRTLNLDALRSFVAIHETGSFRRAAARVNLSPSAVSLQIGKLEDVLGQRLLDRNARRVALTEQGERLLLQARSLLSLSDETMAMFRTPALEGRIALAAPHDLGMSFVPQLLGRMAERYPRIRVDVRLGASGEMLDGFRAGRSNVVLFNDVGPPEITSLRLRSEPLAWLMARGGRAHLEDPLPLAMAETGCSWREAALAALSASQRPWRIAYCSDTSMGQVAALRADLALAALPRSLAQGDLVEVPETAALPALPQTEIRIAHDDSALARAMVSLAGDTAEAALSALRAG
ncbi:LysR family transcriptional regulator [Salipiger abyssi]|uniref:LysR family transcriptional regulator n=1 Tax=Salipiger abyssi TaxID=1250539 RepID=UPI001A90A78A|nr:LysR family transcriptional regulator [Salipiger abyssi]MBN9885792.1 LysR family transcriptional regulator [Salipiger abyssi]